MSETAQIKKGIKEEFPTPSKKTEGLPYLFFDNVNKELSMKIKSGITYGLSVKGVVGENCEVETSVEKSDDASQIGTSVKFSTDIKRFTLFTEVSGTVGLITDEDKTKVLEFEKEAEAGVSTTLKIGTTKIKPTLYVSGEGLSQELKITVGKLNLKLGGNILQQNLEKITIGCKLLKGATLSFGIDPNEKKLTSTKLKFEF